MLLGAKKEVQLTISSEQCSYVILKKTMGAQKVVPKKLSREDIIYKILN